MPVCRALTHLHKQKDLGAVTGQKDDLRQTSGHKDFLTEVLVINAESQSIKQMHDHNGGFCL